MKSLATSEKYGWARYVAHQVYYSLLGREYEWELLPLRSRPEGRRFGMEPIGMGPAYGKIRRGQPKPAVSRLEATAENGPPVPIEHVYKVVDAIDAIAKQTGKSVSEIALNWRLAKADRLERNSRCAERRAITPESRRGELEVDARTSGRARRSERNNAGISLLAPAPVRGADTASGGRNIGCLGGMIAREEIAQS